MSKAIAAAKPSIESADPAGHLSTPQPKTPKQPKTD
jgi:hypothetical protein